MAIKQKNSLESVNYSMYISFLIIIYFDSIFLTIIGYERGENFYHHYYLTSTALMGTFSTFLHNDRYVNSVIINKLNSLYELILIKNKIASLIIFIVIPIIYISII